MSSAVYLPLVLAVMVISGLLGGVASFYISRGKSEEAPPAIGGYLVLGIVASLVVPLLLNMMSSNLLEEAKEDAAKLLPFAGFCLVAAAFSRTFLENIYGLVMRKVSKLESDVEGLKEAASEPDAPAGEIAEDELRRAEVSKDEYEVMRAMSTGKYLYRSLTGLAKDTGLTKAEINRSLNSMIAKNLIAQRSNKEGRLRWHLAPEGRRLLGGLSEAGGTRDDA